MKKPDSLQESWIADYISGTASPEIVNSLEHALKNDSCLRRYFLEYLNIDLALSAEAACAIETRPNGEPKNVIALSTPPPVTRGLYWPLAAKWGKVAAAVGLLALSGVWWTISRNPYATVYAATVNGLQAGQAVRSESFRFDIGAIEFLTAKGARVVVEAPADVRFESEQCLRVFRGKVAADVPPAARGFTVLTPDGGAVDLGTRFGVDVQETGGSEVHVFQGEVIAQARGESEKHSLRTGEATSLSAGASAARGLRSASFIQADELPSLAAGLAAGQRDRANAHWQSIQKDPALIAALDFEGTQSFEGTHRIAQGRWPGSRAPEFVQVGDHLRVDFGGDREFAQLTLAAWVRIDDLGEPYQSLYHTDGWTADALGQVHWMLTKAATMRLALRGNTLAAGSDEKHGFPDSKTPVLPERGRWIHLAAVYDSHARTVRFYLNGAFDKETRQETAWPARLGPAQIGNWNREDRKLSGRLDELLLIGRTLSDEEIRLLHDAGNPYR